MKALSLLGLTVVMFCSSTFAAIDMKCAGRDSRDGLSVFDRCSWWTSLHTPRQTSNPRYIIAGTPVPPPFPVLPNPGFKPPINPTPIQIQGIGSAAGQLNEIEKEIIEQQLRVNERLRKELEKAEQKKKADEQKSGPDNSGD